MGYIGNRPADSYTSFAVQHFTTSATTTYSLDNPVANENEIALFINNVRQEPGSSYAYTASGTTLTLSAATSASDTMYCVFIGKAVQTVTPASGSVTNDMIAYPLAESGATVSTFNRTTSDGDIVELQKDGTTVGSIGSISGVASYVVLDPRTSGSGTGVGLRGANGSVSGDEGVWPTTGTGGTNDGVIALGNSGNRFKDLYLGGNIYLGGTGSANALDDYEEGTWTPNLDFSNSSTGGLAYSLNTGYYVKVGKSVFITAFIQWNANNFTASSGALQCKGLPFTTSSAASYRGGVAITYSSNPWTGVTVYQQAFRTEGNKTVLEFNFSDGTDGSINSSISSYTNIFGNGALMISGTYVVD